MAGAPEAADGGTAGLAMALLRSQSLRAVRAAAQNWLDGMTASSRVGLWLRPARDAAIWSGLPAIDDMPLDLDLADRAVAEQAPQQRHGDGPSCALWPLAVSAKRRCHVLLEVVPAMRADENAELPAGLRLLAVRIDELLRQRRVRRAARQARRSLGLQRALYAISDIASSRLGQTEMLREVHRIVAGLVDAANFLVALRDPRRGTLRFAYFVDGHDREAPDPDAEYTAEDLPNSLSFAVASRGIVLRGPSAELTERLGLAHDLGRGPDALDWLGVPMLADGQAHGAVVVQSYDRAACYDEDDEALLGYVAQHVWAALQRRRAEEALEAEVLQRTGELEAVNRALTEEVHEREAGERLQAALFRIAEITSTAQSEHGFFAALHAVVGELLYARNFFVALLVEQGQAFDFPYAVDERDPGALFARRGLRRGLTEYVMRSAAPLLARRADIEDLVRQGEVETIGTPSVCWLGVPLLRDGEPCGAIVVQSYSPQILYGSKDRDLLVFVALHIATALQRREAQESLRRANAELAQSLDELRRTQGELIENEKMASLGRLVAGVAHEVNTPLGIGVTAVSFLRSQLAELGLRLPAGQAERWIAPLDQAAAMTESNLQRAASLVRTFKQVAVDQEASPLRTVAVREYLEGSLLSLGPALRQGGHRLHLNCDASLRWTTRPDVLHQIVVNLVMNSLIHGYPDGRSGKLVLELRPLGDLLQLRYGDDGVGMDGEAASHLFEPFYTTRRDQGGTGLGLHIVYNLVTQALGGRIRCRTAPGEGVDFEICIPDAGSAVCRN